MFRSVVLLSTLVQSFSAAVVEKTHQTGAAMGHVGRKLEWEVFVYNSLSPKHWSSIDDIDGT